MSWGLEARVPFLDKQMVKVSLDIDAKEKMFAKGKEQAMDKNGRPIMEKHILREAFALTPEGDDKPYLPDSILWRQKEQVSEGASERRSRARIRSHGSEWAEVATRALGATHEPPAFLTSSPSSSSISLITISLSLSLHLMLSKTQFSDGVGHKHIDTLREHAEKVISDEQMQKAAERFPHLTPDTKEAYHYRELFEAHFPSSAAASTVKKWIPKSSWVSLLG